MPGPLSGYRIVDVTQMISGPMATMILADQGADVIKVEPPVGGDLTRALAGRRHPMSPTFAIANRNKRSVVIDLKQPRGIELLKRLVEQADLFVQNFRPETTDRMGIGARRHCIKSSPTWSMSRLVVLARAAPTYTSAPMTP